MDFLNSLSQTWKGLNPGQRVGTVLLLLAAVAVLTGVAWFGNRTEYRSLAAGDPSKIGEIATTLEGVGIKPKVSGNSIQVPVDRFDEAVLTVARAGLNSDGVGFELLDKGASAFTTDRIESFSLMRAVAGELERILRGYPGVAGARVLIAQDKVGWKTGEKDGTASVSLTMRQGMMLTPTDVAAVQACVANAWHSLRPENVAVMANGKKLTRDLLEGSDRQFALANHQLTSQMEYEDALRQRAQAALDKAQGPGKTYVTVSVDLNFDLRTEKTHTVDPDKIVAKKEETRNKTRSAVDASSGGATGVTSNTPSEKGGAGTESGSDSEKQGTIDNDYSTTDRVLEKKGFETRRLSVALFVDKSLKARLPELEKTVKASVGFDEARNDQFSSTAESEFEKLPEELATPAPVSSSNLPELVSTGGRIVALVGLVVLFLFLLRRANGVSRVKTDPANVQETTAAIARGKAAGPGSPAGAPLTGAATSGAPGALPGGGPAVAVGSDIAPEELARQSVAKNAAAAAAADPATAGRVVRSWLEEKRR